MRRLYFGAAPVGQETTEALVLRGVDFSETSRIVTLLTPARGRVACMAKGARRANSPLAAVVDTLNRVEVVLFWKDGRDIQTLAEATLLDRYSVLRGDIERASWAAFPLELAGKVAHENEPSTLLYATLRTGLEQWVPGQVTARTHACWMAARLLGVAGFAPELGACSHCGDDVRGACGFSLDSGIVCPACRGERRLSQAAVETMRALFSEEDDCPAVVVGQEVFQALRAYASRQLETDFRSARVLQDMFGHED